MDELRYPTLLVHPAEMQDKLAHGCQKANQTHCCNFPAGALDEVPGVSALVHASPFRAAGRTDWSTPSQGRLRQALLVPVRESIDGASPPSKSGRALLLGSDAELRYISWRVNRFNYYNCVLNRSLGPLAQLSLRMMRRKRKDVGSM